jgi:hypothetical protein
MCISPLLTPRANDSPSLLRRPAPVVLQSGHLTCLGRHHRVVQKSHRTLLLVCLVVLRLVVPKTRSNDTEDDQLRDDTLILRSTALHTPSNPIFIIRYSAGITTGTRIYLCSLAITTITSMSTSLVCSSHSGILISSHNTLRTLWRHTTLRGPLHFSTKVASHCSGRVLYVSISSTCGFVLRDTIAGYSCGAVTGALVSNKNVSMSYPELATNSRGQWKCFDWHRDAFRSFDACDEGACW